MVTYARPRLSAAPVRQVMRAQDMTLADLARLAKKKDATVRNAISRQRDNKKSRAGLTLDQAEDYAFALGFHPIEMWGDDYLQAVFWEPPYSMTKKAIASRKWKEKREAACR